MSLRWRTAGSFPNVRLRSTDYAYHGQGLRQAAAIRLERIALR